MTLSSRNAINTLIDSFPALPATVTNVLAITSDPECTAKDLMQAIIPDQTMCGAILKVANSAFFGVPKGVSTIERAVVVLGYSEIQNIVIGRAVFGSLPKLKRDSKEEVGRFWDHSFTCGLAAKIIADHYNLKSGEYFVAGLLHDIGKLALLMSFPSKYQIQNTFCHSNSFDDLNNEEEEYGLNHVQAGLKLTQRWMLPDQLAAAVGYHHGPTEATDFVSHALIIQLADLLATLHGSSPGSPPADFENRIDQCLPGISSLWEENSIVLKPECFRMWYELLIEKRQSDQAILNILSGK
jgi:putative nucleotidyltransferase with HDIG domain